jgi:hypothetical protein
VATVSSSLFFLAPRNFTPRLNYRAGRVPAGTFEPGIVSRDARDHFSSMALVLPNSDIERTFMKKEIRIAFVGLALSAAALPSMAAETELRVTVPFAFTAGKASLPAGDYLVSQSENHILTIVGKGGGAMVIAWSAGSTGTSAASALTFERTSRGNALTEVNLFGSATDLTKSKFAIGKGR